MKKKKVSKPKSKKAKELSQYEKKKLRAAKKAKEAAESVQATAEQEPVKDVAQRKPTSNNLLSTGCTLLNLALSDKAQGGFLKGKYYFMVGDSASGKTFLSMTCFAEATVNPNFKNYRLIYDNVEDGCLMDIERLFGMAAAKRIESPAGTKKKPEYSYTIEDFYYNLDDAIKENTPFIYILDSMDGLDSEAAGDKFEEQKKAYRAGKDAPGSYGDGKAKKNSENLRKALGKIGKMGSILLVLCQTRDDLSFGQAKKTRSGGRALKFYATCEIWSSHFKTLKKTYKGKDRKIGMTSKLETRKNRITGKLKTVNVDIYPSYGMDDVGSCIDYLISEGWLKKSKKITKGFVSKPMRIRGTRADLVKQIEEKNLEDQLKEECELCWKEIEDACALKRKSKYVGVS